MTRAYRRLVTVALVTLAACKEGAPQPGGVAVVTLAMRGASAADAEAQLLAPVEAAASQMPGLYSVRGRAFEGGATLDVTFRRSVDVEAATKALRERIGDMAYELPRNIDMPWVSIRGATPVIARMGDHPNAMEAVEREIQRVPGVFGVAECGVRRARLVLELVPSKMAANALVMNDVTLTLTLRGQHGGGTRSSQDEIADEVVGAGGVRTRDVAVITPRSEARCLVDGAVDPKLPALLRVGLRSPRDRAAVEQAVKKAGLVVVPNATTYAAAGRPSKVTLFTGAVGPVVEAVLVGDDANVLGDAGRSALAAVRSVPGVAAAWCEGCELVTQRKLEIDRDGAEARKLVVDKIEQVIRAANAGQQVATYFDGESEVDVILAVEEGGAQWGQMPIRSDEGKVYLLSEVVRATESSVPRDILHISGRRAVALYVRGGPKTSAAELQSIVKAAAPGARVRTVPRGSVDVDSW